MTAATSGGHLVRGHDNAPPGADGHAHDALRQALADAWHWIAAHADHHGTEQTRPRVSVRLRIAEE